MSKTIEVEVRQTIAVTLDEDAFTPEFMSEFREHFYQFKDINDHAKHLAQLYVRGLIDDYRPFIEGYGPPSEFGIVLKVIDADEEVMKVSPTNG